MGSKSPERRMTGYSRLAPQRRRFEEMEPKMVLSALPLTIQEPIVPKANDPWMAIAADVDTDGDQDVLSASFGDDKIAWYENLDGMGHFGPQRVISQEGGGASSVFAADLDGDGDLDVLSSSIRNEQIAWHENLDGRGTFAPPQLITTTESEVRALRAADLDADGDLDVLFANDPLSDGGIAWYGNLDGAASFAEKQLITSTGSRHVEAVDIDGDNDLDVLFPRRGSGPVWYENTDGRGSFPSEPTQQMRVISSELVHAADLDGDGDVDLLAARTSSPKLIWFENEDGGGTFGQPNEFADLSPGGVQSIDAGDVDGDGDMDVFAAFHAQVKSLVWFENLNGTGNFGRQTFIETISTEEPFQGQSGFLRVSDLNGDGFPDVLTGWKGSDSLSWYENMDGSGVFGPRQDIAPSAYGPVSVDASDIDGDGDMDLLSASLWDDKIAWYENTGDTQDPFPQQIITTRADEARSVHAADLDGDGDQDVLSASSGDNTIAWYENQNGTGSFGAKNVITTDVDEATGVHAADLDGDGDLDVLSASRSIASRSGKVAWHENIDGAGNFGEPQLIGTGLPGIQSVLASDVDGDGDGDVLAASPWDDKVVWFENVDGAGRFGAQRIVVSEASVSNSVAAGDFDGDGDLDVAIAGFYDFIVDWYENLDGAGNFRQAQRIRYEDVDISGSTAIEIGDIDNDGDLDIVSAFRGTLAWFENQDGLGDFGPEQVFDSRRGLTSVVTADLDRDGDIDVVSASASVEATSQSAIIWYRNDLNLIVPLFAQEKVIATDANGTRTHIVDLDADGDLDILSTEESADRVVWYKNADGRGGFILQQVITTSMERPSDVQPADLDGDGDLDVVGVSFARGSIGWYANLDGKGHFGSRRVLDDGALGARDLGVADFDGDGDMDVLAKTSTSLVWYVNLDGKGHFGPQQIITAQETQSVSVADIDGDGDFDLLVTSVRPAAILWYENRKDPEVTWDEHVIRHGPFGLIAVPSDVDGDGDIDAITSAYGTIAWYENTDGMGTFGRRTVITNTALLSSHAATADLDNDGDADLLSDRIAWYENIDGRGAFGSQRPIVMGGRRSQSVEAGDIDGDGDMDVVSSWLLSDELVWYENLLSAQPVRQAGDANEDFQFDQMDIQQILAGGKYLTGQPATWEQGDFNGDGLFDRLDIVAALVTGSYLQGPYALGGAAAADPPLSSRAVVFADWV